jgi:hypothetical protein
VSAYSDAVQADNPFAYFEDASAAPWNDVEGGTDITITGATANQTGPLAVGDTKAFSFDGTDDFGQVALNLSDTAALTVECWVYWDDTDTDNDLLMEHTAAWDTNAGGFIINPSAAAGIEVGINGSGKNSKIYTAPSALTWHHHAFVFDFGAAAASEVLWYMDRNLQTENSTPFTGDNSGAVDRFANSTLNLMCRNGASLFADGDIAHLAVYKSALSQARVQAHFDASVVDPPTLQIVQSNLRLA